MRNHKPAAALPLLLLLSGCGEEPGAAVAVRVVEELQAALRAGDAERCRGLITGESAAALRELPWDELRDKHALEVLGTEPEGSGYRVRVRDPNHGGRIGDLLVVREYGRMVVDLVATAGLTAEFTERPVDGGDFVPRKLTPADHDRIRLQQLATPPR